MSEAELQHRIIFGDSRQMSELPDESAHLVITSPPYWQLKDYGAENQIGFDESYQEYIASLNQVWSECNRVLHSGCRICINIGDQFARAAYYGRYKVIPIRERIVNFCESIGLDYMGAIIWQKATTMNTSGGGSVMGSFPHPRNGILKIDYEFILIFKKLGKPPKVSAQQKEKSAMTTEEWNCYFSGHWNFGGERQGDGHIAMFPVELPRRLIKMFSFPGEQVLDPFAGSGTTIRAAMETQRSGVGYEINDEFEPSIRKRLGLENSLFTSSVRFEYQDANEVKPNNPLHVQVDTAAFQRIVDPREYSFGSVISAGDLNKSRDKGVRVREVLSPHRLRLDDGGQVQLLGIDVLPEKQSAALAYLRGSVLNKSVFLKFDEKLHTEDGALLAYVYLGNKTFINAKLLKHGLVRADESVPHRFSARFIAFQSNELNREKSHV